MSILDKLASIFSGPKSSSKPDDDPLEDSPSDSRITVTFTYTGPPRPEVSISDDEINDALESYRFVLANEPEALKPSNRWFDEKVQKRYLRSKSEKAFAWLLPFIPIEAAKLPQLESVLEFGPHSSVMVSKEIRQLIRERRKAKEPYNDLLQSLYNSCVLSDFAESITFENIVTHRMTPFVDIRDLQGICIEYQSIGYRYVHGLKKTDIKWLIEAFGEPTEHRSVESLWPEIRRNAISRFCWGELRDTNETSISLGLPPKTMETWLRDLVTENIRNHKEAKAIEAARDSNRTRQAKDIGAAWTATRAPFVVADLETTGLEVVNAEILEIAALLAEPDGSVTSELSVLVTAEQPIPPVITQLTGITQSEVDAHGMPLIRALEIFLRHIGDRPVFFHNAPFDHGFLLAACEKTKLQFNNPVHDTLVLARHAWPSFSSYKLSALSKYVGASAPKHRALEDARATLAVLLAARSQVHSDFNV